MSLDVSILRLFCFFSSAICCTIDQTRASSIGDQIELKFQQVSCSDEDHVLPVAFPLTRRWRSTSINFSHNPNHLVLVGGYDCDSEVDGATPSWGYMALVPISVSRGFTFSSQTCSAATRNSDRNMAFCLRNSACVRVAREVVCSPPFAEFWIDDSVTPHGDKPTTHVTRSLLCWAVLFMDSWCEMVQFQCVRVCMSAISHCVASI